MVSPSVLDAPEYRRDPVDGKWYTQQDFLIQYGRLDEWEEAERPPDPPPPAPQEVVPRQPRSALRRPAPVDSAVTEGPFAVRTCAQCSRVAYTARSTLHYDPGTYCRKCWQSFESDGVARPVGGLPPAGAPCDQCGRVGSVRPSTDPEDVGRYCSVCWSRFQGDAEPVGGPPSSTSSTPRATTDLGHEGYQPPTADDLEAAGIVYEIVLKHPDERLGIRYERRSVGPLFISEVTEGGPADRAGIVPPAVVVSVDGRSVASATDLGEQLQRVKAVRTTRFSMTLAPGTPKAARGAARRLHMKQELERSVLEDNRIAEQRAAAEEQSLRDHLAQVTPDYQEWLTRRKMEKERALLRPLPISPPPPLRSRRGVLSGAFSHAGTREAEYREVTAEAARKNAEKESAMASLAETKEKLRRALRPSRRPFQPEPTALPVRQENTKSQGLWTHEDMVANTDRSPPRLKAYPPPPLPQPQVFRAR